MNLKELIERNKNNIPSILKRMVEIYPDQEEDLDGYMCVFEKLLSINNIPKNSENWHIRIYEYLDGDECYKAVDGIKDGDEEQYAIEFNPWNNWLSYDITDAVNKWGDVDSIVYVLYEMTFMGFEESEIQDTFNGIIENVEDYKKRNEL
jgi:hypothetical protein